MQNKIGEIRFNNYGSEMIIIEYRNRDDIDVYFPQYNWTAKGIQYSNFEKGSIKCPYEPRTYEIGFLGEGIHSSRIDNKDSKCYKTWKNMLMRCYDEKYYTIHTTYKDCKVCNEWLCFQNFAEWYYEHYYEIEGQSIQLDKDILFKGNKVYSPQTCIFVPQRINCLFPSRIKNKSIIKEIAEEYKDLIPTRLYEAMIID